ncbi:GNAT family N-acetyltransferase [Nocardia sp. NBC_00416]|uniref:GNAT family N-acetyltransferase n=1 Tax=Nocardia sp. NBC_00416 TaxID=2975991 RepID=UPI002E237E77
MISYRWRAALDEDERAQVLALVRAAAGYDAEAGFSTIDPHAVGERSDDPVRVAHLPIRARRDLSIRADAPWVTVAYLNLVVDAEGLGTVRFVVHPDYRSRGIATLLVEELGLDTSPAGGWAGTGARALRAWAYGSHPAAERLATRFGISVVERRWTLVRHLSGPWAVPLAEVDPGRAVPESVPVRPGDEVAESAAVSPASDGESLHGQGRVIAVRDSQGAVGAIRFDTELVAHAEFRAAWIGGVAVAERAADGDLGSALLGRALGEMRAAGAQLALVQIDPRDERDVRMWRLQWFEQEDAHVRYGVGAT